MLMSDAPDPGWYPDPTQAGRYRWWDGAAWSARTRTAPAADADDAADPAPGASALNPADPAPARIISREDELVRPRPVRSLRRPLVLAAILILLLVGAFLVLDPLGSSEPSAEAVALAAALSREGEARADADACLVRAGAEECVAVSEQWRSAVAGLQDSLGTGSGPCTQAVREAAGDAPGVLGAVAQAMIDGDQTALAGLAAGRASAQEQLTRAGAIAAGCQ